MPDPTHDWFTLVGTLGGFVTASLLELIRGHLATSREREARGATRREQRFERRNSFQRETLLDLQETLHRLLRAEGQMNYLDTVASREGSKWHEQPYPEQLNNESHDANVKCMLLTVRVRDDSIRKLAEVVRSKCNSLILVKNEIESRRVLVEVGELFGSLNELIGKELRQLDDDEAGG